MFRVVTDAPVGEASQFAIIRKGKRQTISVIPEERESTLTDEEKQRRSDGETNADRKAGGLSVEALSDEVRSRYRIGQRVEGVRVSDVDRRSPLTGKILKGDIIEAIDFENITTPEEFAVAVASAQEKGTAVQLLIYRSGNYLIYAAEL